MNLFTWLESNMCLCNQQLLSELQDASRAALSAVVWSLGGIGCLMCGSFIAAAQGAADLALMRSDWAWADVVARMRSRQVCIEASKRVPASISQCMLTYAIHIVSCRRSPARRAPLDMYSKDDAFALTPGEAVPKRGIYQTGGGYYIRSPHPDAM